MMSASTQRPSPGRRCRAIALAALIVLAVPTPAGAAAPAATPTAVQPPAVRATLGLGDAVLLARSNGLGVRLQRERLLALLAERRVKTAGGLPRLTIESSANYYVLPPDSPLLAFASGRGSGGSVGFPAPGATVDTSIGASHVVFDAFVLRDTLRIADLQEAIGDLAVVQAEQEAMLAAAAAYFQVLRAEGLTDVARRAVAQARDHLALGQARLAAGAGTRAEVLQLRARIAQAQGELIQAMNGVSVARLTLSNVLNAPVGLSPLAAAPSVPAIGDDVERELRVALDRRPEIRQAVLKRDIDAARETLEGRALLPTLSTGSRYSQRGFYQGQFYAGLNLSWNAFDGFRTRERMAVAQQAIQADQLELELARQAIALEARLQAQHRVDARARIAAAREGLQAAQEACRIARTRFEAGLGAYFELLDAQGALTQALSALVLAQDDHRVAEIRLARALGRDLAAFLAAR